MNLKFLPTLMASQELTAGKENFGEQKISCHTHLNNSERNKIRNFTHQGDLEKQS